MSASSYLRDLSLKVLGHPQVGFGLLQVLATLGLQGCPLVLLFPCL